MNILEQLAPRVVPVECTLSYGTKVIVSMGTLSMHLWDELGDAVADPIAPFVTHNSRGEEVRNYADPGYLKARRQAEAERTYRRLTYAFLRGGNAIPGTLFEEQVESVKKNLDLAIASALIRWQRALIEESRARVLALSATFPSVEAAAADDNRAPGADAAGVAQPE